MNTLKHENMFKLTQNSIFQKYLCAYAILKHCGAYVASWYTQPSRYIQSHHMNFLKLTSRGFRDQSRVENLTQQCCARFELFDLIKIALDSGKLKNM